VVFLREEPCFGCYLIRIDKSSQWAWNRLQTTQVGTRFYVEM
jgi:hypothetical protein